MRRWALLALLGYVMPGSSILKHLAEDRFKQQLFTLRVDGSASFLGSAVKEAGPLLGLPTDRSELQVDATISMKLPLRCRIELNSAEGGKQISEVVGHGKSRNEGGEVAAVNAALGEVCTLLAQRNNAENDAAAIEHHLDQLGVKQRMTSLARYHGTVAFVLGETGDDKPQLWVYKDNFMPARVRFTDEKGNPWDVQLADYTSPATGDWFPRTLEVSRGGELQFRFTALKADTRAPMPDKLF